MTQKKQFLNGGASIGIAVEKQKIKLDYLRFSLFFLNDE